MGSVDPNNIQGPSGYGAHGFVQPELFSYGIQFENESNATAPAQTVVVTQQLDANLDWSSFQLGSMGFGSIVINVPAGQFSYSTRVDLTATSGIYVDVAATFNPLTGLATWTFTSLDPATLDVPTDPLAGFLPPDTNGQGLGFVNYTVLPKNTLTTGDTINGQATVVFDTNAPISTASIANTIDNGPPTSSVDLLPAITTTPSFTVNWSGSDDVGGSGIASYDVYVSDDGGTFSPLLTGTTLTSTTFDGTAGHTYSFYSVATDNVGHVEATPSAAEASTTVDLEQATSLSAVSGSGTYGGTATLTATLTAGGSGLADKTIAFSWVDGTTVTALGTATTDSQGVATLEGVSLAGIDAGTYVGYVGASFAGDSADQGSGGSGDLSVAQATATLTLGGLNPTFDGSPEAVTVTTTPVGLSGVTVTYNGSTTPPTAAGSYSVVATLTNNDYRADPATGTLVIAQASQTITFSSPSSAIFGTTFHVDPVSDSGLPVSLAGSGGCVVVAGSGGGYDVTMTSGTTDATLTATQAGDNNHLPATDVVEVVTAVKATASVVLGNVDLTYTGAPQFATASTTPSGLSVSVSYTQNGTPVSAPVAAGDYNVAAAVVDPNYQGTATETLHIAQATPTITWSHPSDLTYGTPLGSTQLDAQASVTGTFQYTLADATTPAAGAVLGAGSGQVLNVKFTPSDSQDYATVTASATINIDAASPEVSVNPVSFTEGTALDNSQLTGTATWVVDGSTVSVPGTFTYSTDAGNVLAASSTPYTEAVIFTPGDATDFKSVATSVSVTVQFKAVGTAAILSPPQGFTNQVLTFTLNASDPGVSAFHFDINWGDGTPDTVTSGPDGTEVSHAFATTGTKAVTLIVTDPYSSFSAGTSVTVNDVTSSAGLLTYLAGLPSGGAVSFSMVSADQLASIVQALDELASGPSANTGVSVDVSTTPGVTYPDITLSARPGDSLTVDGSNYAFSPGAAAATVVAGSLTIRGATIASPLRVTGDSAALTVADATFPGSGQIQVTGSNDVVTVTGSSFGGDLVVHPGNGNHVALALGGTTVQGSIQVQPGNGAGDSISLSGFQVVGDVTVPTGNGPGDVVAINGLDVAGDLQVQPGNGAGDLVSIANTTVGDISSTGTSQIKTGNGIGDAVAIQGLSVGGGLVIVLGNGAGDSVSVSGLVVAGSTTIQTGNGGDSVALDNTTFDSAFTLLMGNGWNTVKIGAADDSQVSFLGAVQSALGNGDDTLWLGTGSGAVVSFNKQAVFDGQKGKNTKILGQTVVGGPLSLKNFS